MKNIFVAFRVLRGATDAATICNLDREWSRYFGGASQTEEIIWITTPLDGYVPLAYSAARQLRDIALPSGGKLLEFERGLGASAPSGK